MKNRRNYYRILRVQPEAPVEVINASYLNIMSDLRRNVDLGSVRATVGLINEAYRVLSDPSKRREYDQNLHRHHPHASPEPARQQAGSTPAERGSEPLPSHQEREDARLSPPTDASIQSPQRWAGGYCVFCGAPIATVIQPDTRCHRCNSPLAPIPGIPAAGMGKPLERRALPRLLKTEPIVVYPSWPHEGSVAELRDVSLAGLSFVTRLDIEAAQIIKISFRTFDGTARAVSSHRKGDEYIVHAQLLTAAFGTQAGVFLSLEA